MTTRKAPLLHLRMSEEDELLLEGLDALFQGITRAALIRALLRIGAYEAKKDPGRIVQPVPSRARRSRRPAV